MDESGIGLQMGERARKEISKRGERGRQRQRPEGGGGGKGGRRATGGKRDDKEMTGAEECTYIISTAQHARPKVIGHIEP